MNNRYQNKKDSEFQEKVVQIKRVSKKTKGGNQISFTALVVSGDKKSRVGVALGKAKNVADAIKKGVQKAQKNLINVEIVDGTIPHQIKFKFKSAVVLIKPGRKGGGLIAGGPVRAVLELAGIKDVASKIIRSKNKSVNVWAVFKALSKLKS
ncbi:30S ribosomal protein S5 [Patescibacteria group bacterium]|nr:30S ribosomal protein S5 [Patescibacteria group bacterium]MCG2702436.1 30S ribosomal protein S5 [Candidatus Parcubacteria bacterium]MBU4210324.1 30S ribosomal protein S5 [Patescibacteria group bacterium]MBU4264514.1 30S ribosomal protein S5 [Patescibacteria group bacterium]MBU4390445.1 30S ribosomal protein S5 [Patescibacteria group bacterium]